MASLVSPKAAPREVKRKRRRTILPYQVDAQIGGKLAQLGGRLINSTSKKLAGEFFSAFGEVVGGTADAPVEADAGSEELDQQADRNLVSPRAAIVFTRITALMTIAGST